MINSTDFGIVGYAAVGATCVGSTVITKSVGDTIAKVLVDACCFFELTFWSVQGDELGYMQAIPCGPRCMCTCSMHVYSLLFEIRLWN